MSHFLHNQELEEANRQFERILEACFADKTMKYIYNVPTFGISTGISTFSFIGKNYLSSKAAPSVGFLFNPNCLLGTKDFIDI